MAMSRRSKYIAAAVLAALLALPGYLLVVTKGDNFHVITEGEAYRSAQLDGETLARYIRLYTIQSVINLRDEHPGEAWYDRERETCEKLGVAHYDVRLRSYQRPKDWQIEELLETFASAPRPVLIHCRAGADRSGLAAAMWKVVVDKEPKDSAKKQLSLRYGHLPFGKPAILDRYFEEWQPGEVSMKPAKGMKRARAGKMEAADGSLQPVPIR
ncbi:MAG: dual specificity protein phosphatase family protein [Nitrospirota bacterium]